MISQGGDLYIVTVFLPIGNAGAGKKITNLPDLKVSGDFMEVRQFCKRKNVTLVVVGPEQPLVDGITDALQKDDIAVFGPSRAGVILEESKAWSKDFMTRHGIPTASYQIFRRSDGQNGFQEGEKYIDQNWPVVVKASGLAAGKGAIVPKNQDDAYDRLGPSPT